VCLDIYLFRASALYSGDKTERDVASRHMRLLAAVTTSRTDWPHAEVTSSHQGHVQLHRLPAGRLCRRPQGRQPAAGLGCRRGVWPISESLWDLMDGRQ